MLAILLAATLTVTVPENRAIQGGRTIDLHVVVVERSDKPDAIFVLAGGPGVGAARMESWIRKTFAGTDRDIVLVDARGTGQSHSLACTMPGTEQEPQGYFDAWLDLDAVAKCREELEPRADLTQYTTAAIADDIEAVRKHLGYAQMDLYGTSYGTRVAQELMRRYPKSIRTVILDGVVPPMLAGPSEFAEDADRTLKAVFGLCRADAECHAAFPSLEADYAKVLKDAEDGVTINSPTPVTVPRGMFGEIMRNFLYSPEVYVKLPLTIHQAASGDWTLFAEMATRYTRGTRTLSYGMFLSISCAEDVPRFDVAKAKTAAEGTLLGSFRIDQQLAACKLWPRGKASAASTRLVKSSIPTLIVSGELDPATPPRYGDQVLRGLSRGRHLVFPNGSHSGDTGGCLEKVLSEFVEEGSVKTLDTSCVAKVQRPPFALANATTSGKN